MDKLKNKLTKFKLKMNQKIDKIKKFINNNDVEITMLIGVLFVLYATFLISYIIFLYLTGLVFIALSVYLLKFSKK